MPECPHWPFSTAFPCSLPRVMILRDVWSTYFFPHGQTNLYMPFWSHGSRLSLHLVQSTLKKDRNIWYFLTLLLNTTAYELHTKYSSQLYLHLCNNHVHQSILVFIIWGPIPTQKWPNFLTFSQMKNRKPHFSPTFQKSNYVIHLFSNKIISIWLLILVPERK